VNARWSNIVAILAGDYLLAQASSLAASLGADVAAAARGDDRRAVPRAGARVAALVRPPIDPRSPTSRRSRAKTATLMATFVPHRRDGERRVGRTHSTRSRSSVITSAMCFQVVDDVLDVTATEAELGKADGQRRSRRRSTRCRSSTRCRRRISCARCSGASSNGPTSRNAVDLIATLRGRRRVNDRCTHAREERRPRH